jgi:hypothetical protein
MMLRVCHSPERSLHTLSPRCCSEPIRALKRLMRDAFGEILSIRGRVDELERAVGIDSSRDDIDDASQLTMASSSARQLVAAQARPVQALTGTLSIGGGLLWAEARACSLQ